MKGIGSVNSIQCLIKDILPRCRLLWAHRCSRVSSNSLACTCSASGHSFRPWRFNASRIHPFCGPWAAMPEASIGRPLGCLISRGDLANNGLGRDFYGAGTQVSEADWYSGGPWVQFLIGSSWYHRGRQLVPHAGSASMWTCMQCPWIFVLPWTLTIPNGGMVTFWVVCTGPQTSSRQNPPDTVGLELGERVTSFPISPSSFDIVQGNWSNPDIAAPK